MIIPQKDLVIGEYYYEKNNCGEIFINHYRSRNKMDFIRVEDGKVTHLSVDNSISWVCSPSIRRLATYQETYALQLCIARGSYKGVSVSKKEKVYEIY